MPVSTSRVIRLAVEVASGAVGYSAVLWFVYSERVHAFVRIIRAK